jgi:hypothetical protein
MMPFALLPPMPLGPRLVLGLLGTLFAGVLNLVFRRATVRWWQLGAALLISPVVIFAASGFGLNSGQPTEYVFLGAVVGIICIRGSRPAGPIPALPLRAVVVFIAFAVLGPVVGVACHYSRYQAGVAELHDDWEIQLSIEDGVIASIAGCVLAGIMALASVSSGLATAGRKEWGFKRKL